MLLCPCFLACRWGFTLPGIVHDCASLLLQLRVHGPPRDLLSYADVLNASIALNAAAVELYSATFLEDGSLSLRLNLVLRADAPAVPSVLLCWFRVTTGSYVVDVEAPFSPWSSATATDVAAYRALHAYLLNAREQYAGEVSAVSATSPCEAREHVLRIASGQVVAVDRALDVLRHAWLQGLSV